MNDDLLPPQPVLSTTLCSEVLAVLRESVSPGARLDEGSGACALLDLGIDSMRLISIIVTLESRIGLDFDRVVDLEPPRTVADLFDLAARGCTPPPSASGKTP